MNIGTVLLIAFFVGVVVAMVLTAYCQRRQFEKRFPLISDEEFLARCTHGTDPAVALRVREIISESLGVEYGRIYPESRWVEDLGA